MARPLKNEAERLTRRLPHIRCTEEEYAVLRSKAAQADVTVSDYMRRMILNGKIVVQQSRFDFLVVDQLRRIGVNLNQQTKRLNMGDRVSPELKALWAKIDAILDRFLEEAP